MSNQIDSEETKRYKARQLRYRKAIVKNLNLDFIREELYEIEEECNNVKWYFDSEDGSDSLLNALDGDSDEEFEFKMMFCDLCAECEQMQEDLQNTYVQSASMIYLLPSAQADMAEDCWAGTLISRNISA